MGLTGWMRMSCGPGWSPGHEMRGAPVDKAALLKDLRKQVTTLEDDLRARTDSAR